MFVTALRPKSNRACGKNRAGADHLKPMELCNQSTTEITVLIRYRPSGRGEKGAERMFEKILGKINQVVYQQIYIYCYKVIKY